MMSGPLKFWLLVAFGLAAFVSLLWAFGRGREQPGPAGVVEAKTAAVPAAEDEAPPAEDPPQPAASPATETLPPVPDPPSPLSIHDKMAVWSAAYREQMSFVAQAVETAEAYPTTDRAVCNDLLTTTYNAQNELQEAPDPDIETLLRQALDSFAQGGRACLRQNAGLRDTHLLVGRTGIALLERLLAERYSETGVPGLAAPMEEGSERPRRPPGVSPFEVAPPASNRSAPGRRLPGAEAPARALAHDVMPGGAP